MRCRVGGIRRHSWLRTSFRKSANFELNFNANKECYMSDRGVFLAAFLTVVLLAAGAFAIPEFFVYELLTSTIFVVIAVMVFFGDDKFPYMLGILAPLVWFIFKLLLGELFRDLRVLKTFLRGIPTGRLDTPLHGFALLAAAVLLVVSARAWRKEV